MAMNTGFQHQRPFGYSAAVRSVPSPQHGAHLELKAKAATPIEEIGERPHLKR